MREDILVVQVLLSIALFLPATIFVHTSMLIKINGYSMDPNISDGDVVLCNKLMPEIEEGDIISFKKPGDNYTVMHRVYKKYNSSYFKTKGDNNSILDRYKVPRGNIRCRYITVLES